MKTNIRTELVEKAKKGNSLALKDLLVKSDNLIRSVSDSFHFRSETEDIIQDIKVKILENIRGLRDCRKYQGWAKSIARNHCIDIYKKKKPYLLEHSGEGGEDFQTRNQYILESTGLKTTSEEEFEKAESTFEARQRIENITRALDQGEVQLLKLRYLEDLTLEELAKLAIQGNLKKSSLHEKINISKARWIVEEANDDWENSNYKEAKNKLLIISNDAKPNESSKEKRHLLSLALTRLGDIDLTLGYPDQAIGFFSQSKDIWDGLRNKTMAAYAIHKIALCNNVRGTYFDALKILNEAKEGYSEKNAYVRCLLGDLERDMGAIYFNMGEVKLAISQIDKSLRLLVDANHRQSYCAAQRKSGDIKIRLKKFDDAYLNLKESLKYSPGYNALFRVQTKISFADLYFSTGDIARGLEYAKAGKKTARQYGLRHQLSNLEKIMIRYGLTSLS